jgi:hypothetical protein
MSSGRRSAAFGKFAGSDTIKRWYACSISCGGRSGASPACLAALTEEGRSG